eukprot:1194481-Prorocentrum_minimum.AAC.3
MLVSRVTSQTTSGYLPTWCEAYLAASSKHEQSSTSSACPAPRQSAKSILRPCLDPSSSLGDVDVVAHQVEKALKSALWLLSPKAARREPSFDQLVSGDKVTSLDGAALHATQYHERGTGANGPAESDINSEDFNQYTLRDAELVPAVVGVFESLGLCQRTGVTTEKVSKMVQTGMLLYHNQPYHNFRHAFDVFQATNVLLHRTGLVEVASAVEIFSLLVAALLHDGACDLRNSTTQSRCVWV